VNLDDTIVAIATPAGRGGIGVVRLAGARARDIALPIRPETVWRALTRAQNNNQDKKVAIEEIA